jgi:hypothetical protein
MGVADCDKCDACGSNLARSPDTHAEPVPHDFSLVQTVQTDEGPKPLSRCRFCMRTRAEIAARQAKAEPDVK